MNVSCKNLTPAELVSRLAEQGISRDERVLTDWRAKGILPELQRVGLGRGHGTSARWTNDVLEQAVAAHYLMEYYERFEFVVTGLWLSGFEIAPEYLKSAWSARIQHSGSRMQKQASRFRSGFIGLIRSWSRKLLKKQSPPDFFGEFLEWRYDDSERDSEAIRLRLVEYLGGQSESRNAPNLRERESYQLAEEIWNEVQPEELFIPENAIRFVDSLSPQEISSLAPVFAGLRAAIHKLIDYPDPEHHLFNLRFSCRLMSDFLGPVAIAITKLQRADLNLPLAESIFILDDFATEVQLADQIINRNSDILLTLEERKRWVKTRRRLRRLWSEVI